MPRVYMYVIARDFGFAANPFHGVCTLATCKPNIRRTASPGDWIFGMGGCRLNAVGRCIFAMRVEKCLSFNDYWNDPEFTPKRPVRNGSRKSMVGDNIYDQSAGNSQWYQADSHHSLPDGSPNDHNIERDTQTNRVLISQHFVYFGSNAPHVPKEILSQMKYENVRDYRVFLNENGNPLVKWFEKTYGKDLGQVLGDPFDFDHSSKRYSAGDDKVS